MNRPADVNWEFGSFRLDATQRLLFRNGELVPLSRKAIEVLAFLVERHGQLIEKEELMRQVWPDSFVEESNLAVHISQLRKVLGEQTEYRIDTIPRRGYRFVGTVLGGPASGLSSAEISPATGLPAVIVALAEPAYAPIKESSGTIQAGKTPSKSSNRSRRIVWLAVAAAIGVAAGLLIVVRLHKTPAPVPARVANEMYLSLQRSEIVLGPIANNTGDPVFDTTLHEAIAIELEQSPYLSLISEQRLRQSLKLMGKPADAALTPDLARQLCERTGGAAVIDGWIAKLGAEFVLGVRAVNCRSGDHLADLQTTAASKEAVLKALGDLTVQLRAKLGESLATVQKFDTPIEEATTSSLEALQAYSIGRETMVQKGESAACVPFFEKAIRLDPGFAIAYAALGNAYANLGESGLAESNIRKAYQLRTHVSEHESFYIESHFYQFVTGDLVKASQSLEQWAATYPNDDAPRTNLAVIYSDMGKFDRSLEFAKEAVRLASHDSQSYANLVDAYISLDQLSDAKAVAAQAQSQNLDSSALRLYLYDVAWLEKNTGEIDKELKWASGEPGVEDAFIDHQANDFATLGQWQRARERTDRAVDSAKRADEKETAALYELEEAQREAEFGNDAQALKAAEMTLALTKNRETEFGAGVAFALGGDTARAQSFLSQLDKDFPDDTFVQYLYLPTMRGAIAVKQKDPDRAVKALEAARPYEMGVESALLPVYVRGLAYLEAKDGAKAAAEFQKIIDHPGVVQDAPIGPLARLQLGRAYLLQGNAAQSKAAYDDFLNRWKGADADVPILREAQTEYAAQWKP
jgi:DNA-binding winged helix-turn-helix (wHTH) protein/tetratricopeptide (TPR) repeat protein